MQKKGEAGQLQAIVMVVVAAGLLIGAGLLVITEVRSSLPLVSNTVINESGFINSSGYTVTKAGVAGFASPTIVRAINGTSGVLIPSGNYTISSTGVIRNATASVFPTANITYSYNYGGDAYAPMSSVLSAILKVPTFMAIIVLVAVLAVVILLVMKFAGKGGTSM